MFFKKCHPNTGSTYSPKVWIHIGSDPWVRKILLTTSCHEQSASLLKICSMKIKAIEIERCNVLGHGVKYVRSFRGWKEGAELLKHWSSTYWDDGSVLRTKGSDIQQTKNGFANLFFQKQQFAKPACWLFHKPLIILRIVKYAAWVTLCMTVAWVLNCSCLCIYIISKELNKTNTWCIFVFNTYNGPP